MFEVDKGGNDEGGEKVNVKGPEDIGVGQAEEE